MRMITLSHGSGGRLTHNLIEDLFYKHFQNDILLQGNDASVLPKIKGRIAVSTDSFVIHPIFFKGGDIGKLSVCGTVNDLAMGGAKPLYITVGFIIEEGFSVDDLEKIVISIANTAKEANVKIVAGDTKVVEKGSADKIYINTTGIGVIENDMYFSGENINYGDKIIVSGYIGDHGVSIMSQRRDMEFDVPIESDCGLLNHVVEKILKESRNIRVFRDPTRGGLVTTLNEFVKQSKKSMMLYEEFIPIRDEVESMCEILGLDPLYMANEGKFVVIVSKDDAEKVLRVLKNDPMGENAKVIGEVIHDDGANLYMKTELGPTRILNMPAGELLPRIC